MRFGGSSTKLRALLPYHPVIRMAESWGRLAVSAAANGLADRLRGHGYLRSESFIPLAVAARRVYPVDDDTALRHGLPQDAARTAGHLRAYLSDRAARQGRPAVLVIMNSLTNYGGNLSVVQLINDLNAEGWNIAVAVLSPHRPDLHDELKVAPRFYLDRRHFLAQAPAADVVVATFWTTAYAALDLFAARGDFIPTYFVQDFEPWFYPEDYAYLRARVADTYRLIPVSFAKTPWLCERVREAGGRASRVPPALDMDRFQPSSLPGTGVLAMMRPESPQRGFETIKWLFEQLHAQRPDVALVGFGSDAVDGDFENLGRVANEAMPAVYQRARIFIECSDFHGFGRTVAEALACGVPCVVTDSGGVDSFARDGVNALVVPRGARQALLDAVLRLVDDDALHARLRANARASVQGFERHHSSRRTGDLLRDLQEKGECEVEYL